MTAQMPPNLAIPNLCSPQSHTQYELISAVADPFAINYLPLRRGGNVTVAGAPDFGYGGAGIVARDFPPQDGTLGVVQQFDGAIPVVQGVGNVNGGAPLLSIPPIKSVEWWHVTIWAQELIRDFTTDPNVNSQSAIRSARQVSMLKARIIWTEFPSQAREIIVDIGTGIDIFIGPTNQMFAVEIMVPNPASAPVVRPAPFTTAAPGPGPSVEPPRFRLDAWVVASAWCVYGAIGRPEGRYTQSAALSAGLAPVPPQLFVDIPVPDNARRVQIFSTNDPDSSAVPNRPAIWGFENPQPPVGGSPVPIVLTPLGLVQFGNAAFPRAQTPIVEVPQTAKFLRVQNPGLVGGATTTQTAVFKGQQ